MSDEPVDMEVGAEDLLRHKPVPLGNLQSFMEEVELVRNTDSCCDLELQTKFINQRHDFNLEDITLPAPYSMTFKGSKTTVHWPPSERFLRAKKTIEGMT